MHLPTIRDSSLNVFTIQTVKMSSCITLRIQTKNSSSPVVNDEYAPIPANEKDDLYHHPLTYPGHRLPHAWLSQRIPNELLVSTIDLAGKGHFTILTIIGGQAWKDAAQIVSKSLGVPIKAYSIGNWNQLRL
jgi:hypothetical protein